MFYMLFMFNGLLVLLDCFVWGVLCVVSVSFVLLCWFVSWFYT